MHKKIHSLAGRFLFPALSIVFLLASCSDNSNGDDGGQPVVNVNANSPSVPFSTRLEIPRLNSGSHNQFIVKEAKLNDNSFQTFVNFCVEYDQQKKASRWTAYRWDIDNTYDSHCGRAGDFADDPAVPQQFRVGSGYYRGYQRGHMLASEDRQCSVDANRQTFYMTNMHPQYKRFNAYDDNGDYVWLNAESLVRSLYKGWTRAHNSRDTIYVVKGGTIDKSSDILDYTSNSTTSQIIVPKYYFIALLYKSGRSQTQGGYKAIALWIPHRQGDTTKGKAIAAKYSLSIKELEEKTGIDFFCNLPDDIENQVEQNISLRAWGWD